MFYRPHQKKFSFSITSRRPRKRAVPAGRVYDPWEYNSVPADDREWMKKSVSSRDKEALSRAITGGCEPEED